MHRKGKDTSGKPGIPFCLPTPIQLLYLGSQGQHPTSPPAHQ